MMWAIPHHFSVCGWKIRVDFKSAYCVYAFDADAGTSTVTEDGTPRT